MPLDQIVANLQFEMIGRPDAKVPPHTLWLTGYERSTLGPELARRGAKLVQDPASRAELLHPLRQHPVRAARRDRAHRLELRASQGLSPASDEIRIIDFPHMTDAIRSMLAPIRWLADSTFKPDWLPGKKP